MTVKWTELALQQEALKYETRSDFSAYSSSAYQTARRKGTPFFEKICSHMAPSKTEAWSDCDLYLEALKYNKRSDLEKNNLGAYKAILKRKIVDRAFAHMQESATKAYTDKELKNIAHKYSNRAEFGKMACGAYQAAVKKGKLFMNSICGHMSTPQTEAWTKEELHQEALKYKTKKEFQEKNGGAYVTARKKNWYSDITQHMIDICNYSTSEKELFNILKNTFPQLRKHRDMKVKIKDKPHIRGFDIDMICYDLKRGIEFDGTWSHSLEGLKRGRPNWPENDLLAYHEIKDEYFSQKGIKILHIKEIDWNTNKQKCIDECLRFLNNPISKTKID